MKKHLLALLLLLCAFSASAYDFTAEYRGVTLYFNILMSSDYEVEVTYGNPQDGPYYGDVEIPESVKCGSVTYSVTAIGSKAFYSCSDLTSVTIPNSVKSIGQYAFYKSSSLVEVDIPDSVTVIDDYAFAHCSSFAKVSIPDSPISLGLGVFTQTAFYNDESNWENGVLYSGHHLIRAHSTQTRGTYAIKAGTLTIAPSAFIDCCDLVEVVIPGSVFKIGDDAFNGCKALASVDLPNSLSSIGQLAFAYCESLTEVDIPDGVCDRGRTL